MTLPDLTPRLIALAAIIGLVILLLIFGPMTCSKLRSLGAQNRLNQEQSSALANSAADAVATQGAANKREADSEALTRSNERDIRNADGSEQKVSPAVRDAGLRSLCARAAYRNSERCRLLLVNPK